MNNKLLSFLADEALASGFKPKSTSRTFKISENKDAEGVLYGSVYCVAVILSADEQVELENEAISKNSLKTKIKNIKRIKIENNNELIPLYWGKDAAVGYRLYRHILNKKPKAGCIGLRFYKSLQDKDLILASLPVNDFKGFEEHMENKYPPMLYNVKRSSIHFFT
ncbi:MAG: hypothetical protein DIZ80_13110 [endosymbiont of Galathealinum brachiosum]|uniref:Uncharacterized protein n=1 Tax=endosymbiont of Galathealinum brachiosum TaxID=2200906 RepID=A0A370D9L5_9GAMM|nr:MAG: hypothetical protein DIZ80_13110 [endosymbiont of Galathealinum brachiosum]